MGGGLRANHQWLLCAVCLLVSVLEIGGSGIPLTILESAKAKGAVCLDGSPPAYHFDKGSGSGINSWVVHMEGGGWCEDTESCVARKSNFRGSSSHMEKSLGFSGILGSKQASNPDFYNWNRIKIRYCDGSSFTGEGVDVKNNLFFRGERIWEAIIAELLALGMKNAQNAILSGCSAGGLASILHCDKFKSLLPASARVKCVSDAGYFVHGKDISGGFYIEKFFTQVVQLHGSAKNLPASCTSRIKPELCFFPQNVAQTLKTPLFIINSAFDSYQIKNILAPNDADPKGTYKSCKLDLKKCTATQLQTVQDYRTQFLNAVTFGGGNLSSRGLWIDSCYAHCQSGSAASWSSDKSTLVENTRMGKAVGDWFFERSAVKKIDCPKFPCNPTCLEVDS